eukprot:11554485-Alexandrium_andersonii.AAC.1
MCFLPRCLQKHSQARLPLVQHLGVEQAKPGLNVFPAALCAAEVFNNGSVQPGLNVFLAAVCS